jgi:murein L,D-transpeptidase YcbB/YkuD
MRALCLALLGILASEPELRWSRQGEPTEQALALVALLQSAALQGLDAEDYDGALWSERLAEIHSRSGQRAFDDALTSAAERYVGDLSLGRIDPREAGLSLERPAGLEVRAFVRELAAADDVEGRLREAEPPFAAYRSTLLALRQYLELARRDPGPPLAASDIVRPGARWSEAGRLAERLWLLGDLPGPVPVPDRYAGALVSGVRRFQARHALAPDGRIGPLTLEALNLPLSRRVEQLRLSLERMRWLPRNLPAPPIVVNIPEYRLRAFGPPDVLAMNVVVGTAYEHPTPIFTSTLQRVVFRPPWIVPTSIERDELAAEFERDPRAMSRLGFQAIDRRGRVVAPARAARGLRTGDVRLRQAPGPKNALGLVKFDLPNPFGVYLHGTPDRGLFALPRRDFSHGCIRLEDAPALAARVLGWTPESVRAAMRGDRTFAVDVPVKFPVLILYSTAVVREDGAVRFLEDVYGEDLALERALELSRAQGFRTTAARGPQDPRPSFAAPRLQ